MRRREFLKAVPIALTPAAFVPGALRQRPASLDARTQPDVNAVRGPWQPDGWAWRGQLALLMPHSDVEPDSEWFRLAPEGVSVQAMRVTLVRSPRHRETRFQDQEVLGSAMKRTNTQFALCLDNAGNEASLIVGKVYRALRDPRAAKDHLIRVVDESGEDYLFARAQFAFVDFPQAVRRKLLALQKAG